MKHNKFLCLLITLITYTSFSAFAEEKPEISINPAKPSAKRKKNFFPFEKEAMKNPNICPVCGRSWDLIDGKNLHK
ncbi:MAG: hypothetical protein ACYTFY_05795, partial [Planctomycetota bacterium]